MSNIHPVWYIVLTLGLALIPLIMGTTTSYLKISLALGVLRNGFGAQQVPNNTIIMVLSLVLSLFIMQPTFDKVIENSHVLAEISWEKMPAKKLFGTVFQVIEPWREFLKQHAGAHELSLLEQFAGNIDHAGTRLLIPAFVLTELKEGLMMGFVLLLPFLVIDLIVANLLAGLGLYMMSPTIISLPLKLLLFVSVDGWLLLSRGFIASYAVGS